jgi:hypothetical protein
MKLVRISVQDVAGLPDGVYSANRLDMVEVVTCCMREFKVKIPRSELNELQNIGDLVDMLHQVAQQANGCGG